MAALRLTRLCGCMVRPAIEKTASKTIVNRGLMTSAARLKREITIIDPDKDENQKSVAKTDKHGKLAVRHSMVKISLVICVCPLFFVLHDFDTVRVPMIPLKPVSDPRTSLCST